MTVSIKLDSAAMAALFPEGTEARVELQRAVIAHICTQFIKPAWIKTDIETDIARLRARITKEVMETVQIKNGFGEFTSYFKEELRREVNESIDTTRRKYIEERLESALKDAPLNVQIDRVIKERVTPMVDAAVKARLAEVVNALMPKA